MDKQLLLLDCAENYSSQANKIKNLGVAGMLRYYNPLTHGHDSGKSLTPMEARNWASVGIPVGIVVEGYGLSNGTGVDSLSGTRDAQDVLKWMPTVGLSPNPKQVVWFAVDTDATEVQIDKNEVAYFDSIKKIFNTQPLDKRPQIGIYGSGWSCMAMLGTKRVDKAWVAGSKGWSRYQQFVDSKAWTLLQSIYSHEKWNGFNADTNVVNGTLEDVGVKVPFGGSIPVVEASAGFTWKSVWPWGG